MHPGIKEYGIPAATCVAGGVAGYLLKKWLMQPSAAAEIAAKAEPVAPVAPQVIYLQAPAAVAEVAAKPAVVPSPAEMKAIVASIKEAMGDLLPQVAAKPSHRSRVRNRKKKAVVTA